MSPRRMEEASVAGESPDKSEQQKSSGTTRSEADPRLAVFREPASPAEPGRGTDSATAVFRTQRAEPETADADSGADAEGGAVDDGAAEADAVAEDGADSVAGAGRGADSGIGAGRGTDSEVGAERGAGRDAEAEAEAEPEPKDEAEEPASIGAAEADDVTPGGPGALAGAVGATEAAEGAESPAEAPEAGREAAQASGEPGEPAEDVEAVEPPGATDEPADEPAGESAEAAEPEGGDARLRAAVAAWVSEDGDADGHVDAESEAPAGDGDDTAAAVTPEASDRTDAAPDEDETPSSDAVDAEAAATGSEARVPGSRKKPVDESVDASVREGTDDSADDSDDQAQPAGDARGVDQATAVFKMPRLPRVDQPTTALKITPPPAGPTSEIGARPEAPAERTSKFVKLREDDVRPAPAPRAPQPFAPAATPPGAGQQQPAASLSGAERTRQQPMPPRPPLDLLAELTNTPPPPETPVRTAVRRVKIWTPLLLLLLIVFAVVQMVRPLPDPALTMTAESSYSFKGGDLKLTWPDQGQSAVTVDGVGTMGSAGAQKPAPIASVAKIMTAYVVLKEHPLTGKEQGELITVDQQAEDESKIDGESTAPISKGQKFTEKQMLQLLMIPSGNNAARLFARWDSSETEFIAKMNAAAKDLGMTGTTYTDPSGLKKTTVSTANDQLKLARAVMQNEIFRKIVDTPQIEIDGIDPVIYNNNKLLLEPGVSGIKTGSSTPAGGNLIWSANTVVDGKTLWIYGAVMGQQAGAGHTLYDSLQLSLDNSLKLIKDAQDAVTSAVVVKKGDVVGYVDDGFGGRTPLVATGDLKAKGWAGLKVELSVTGNGKEISRSMKAGTKVGVVTVGTGPGRVSAPVALQRDLKDPSFTQKLTRIG